MPKEHAYTSDFCIKEDNFHRLYSDFYPSLVLFATRLLGDQKEAEDVVQNVFIHTWESRKTNSLIDNIAVYLYQAVKYRCLNELRNQKNHRLIEQDVLQKEESYFEDLCIQQETIRRIHAAINQLPPRCKEVFVRSMNGSSNKDIAEELQLAEETVKKQKKIARQFLKEKLGPIFYCFF